MFPAQSIENVRDEISGGVFYWG